VKKHSLIPRNDQCPFFSQKHGLTRTHWALLTLPGLSQAAKEGRAGGGRVEKSFSFLLPLEGKR